MTVDDEEFDGAARKVLFGTRRLGAEKSAVKNAARHSRVKVTINIDGDIVEHFKAQATQSGRPYQMLINDALRDQIEGNRPERTAREAGKLLLEDSLFIEALADKLKDRK